MKRKAHPLSASEYPVLAIDTTEVCPIKRPKQAKAKPAAPDMTLAHRMESFRDAVDGIRAQIDKINPDDKNRFTSILSPVTNKKGRLTGLRFTFIGLAAPDTRHLPKRAADAAGKTVPVTYEAQNGKLRTLGKAMPSLPVRA